MTSDYFAPSGEPSKTCNDGWIERRAAATSFLFRFSLSVDCSMCDLIQLVKIVPMGSFPKGNENCLAAALSSFFQFFLHFQN
jgi:hypothetical protein